MPISLTNTNGTGGISLRNTNNSGRINITYVANTYRYDSTTLLSWPATSITSSYVRYAGAWTSTDDGYSTTGITLPVNFSTNNQSSNKLYLSTNGYFTLTSGLGGILSGPTTANPAVMAANPADLWLSAGSVTNTDGDVHNWYYQTGSNGTDRYYVYNLVYCGTFQATTTPKSYIINFYRDGVYEWLEARAKSNVVGSAGPYNSVSVAQASSTISKVWRGDLNGLNWVYMGTGSVQL